MAMLTHAPLGALVVQGTNAWSINSKSMCMSDTCNTGLAAHLRCRPQRRQHVGRALHSSCPPSLGRHPLLCHGVGAIASLAAGDTGEMGRSRRSEQEATPPGGEGGGSRRPHDEEAGPHCAHTGSHTDC